MPTKRFRLNGVKMLLLVHLLVCPANIAESLQDDEEVEHMSLCNTNLVDIV